MISSITRLFILLANLTKNPKKVRKTRNLTPTHLPFLPRMKQRGSLSYNGLHLRWPAIQVHLCISYGKAFM
jgi:hypothetical protein